MIGSVKSKKEKEMKKYLLMFVAAMAMVSCTTDPDNQLNPDLNKKIVSTINATEDVTRTALNEDGLSIDWLEKDEIYVWPSGEASKALVYATAEGGHRSAIFTAETTESQASNLEGKKLYSIYPYFQKAGETEGTYVPDMTIDTDNKVSFTLGYAASDDASVYYQYSPSTKIDEMSIYSSASRSHYDVLYGSTNDDSFDDGDAIAFKHAFTAVRFSIPKDGWFDKTNTTAPEGSPAGNYQNAFQTLLSENGVLSANAKLELNYIQLEFAEHNVTGVVTLDPKTGDVSATNKKLRVYTLGMNSNDENVFWAFFPAANASGTDKAERVAMPLSIKLYGSITDKDGNVIKVEGFTKELVDNKAPKFTNGDMHSVRLSIKDFIIAPIPASQGSTTTRVNYFDINTDFVGFDPNLYGQGQSANHVGDVNDNKWYYESPKGADGTVIPTMRGWSFYCVNIKNTESNNQSGWWGEASAINQKNRFLLVRDAATATEGWFNTDYKSGFCTAPIALPEGITATATVTFNAYNNTASFVAQPQVYVGKIASTVTPNGENVVTSVQYDGRTALPASSSLNVEANKLVAISKQVQITNGDRIAIGFDSIDKGLIQESSEASKVGIVDLVITYSYTETVSAEGKDGYVF